MEKRIESNHNLPEFKAKRYQERIVLVWKNGKKTGRRESGWQNGKSIHENWHILLENIKMHKKQNLEEKYKGVYMKH